MLIGSMIHYHIQHNPDAALVTLLDEQIEIIKGAKARVYSGVIRDIVAEIAVGCWVEGGEPDGIDPQDREIVEF